jgi:hypothetical protein
MRDIPGKYFFIKQSITFHLQELKRNGVLASQREIMIMKIETYLFSIKGEKQKCLRSLPPFAWSGFFLSVVPQAHPFKRGPRK